MGMRQLSLFDEDLLSCPMGEAQRGDGRVHQATAASVRTEPIRVDLMQEVVNRENVICAWKRVRANKGSPDIDGMSAPGSRRDLRGESPFPGECPLPVAEGNCVAVRRGGEQPEANMQSVG